MEQNLEKGVICGIILIKKPETTTYLKNNWIIKN